MSSRSSAPRANEDEDRVVRIAAALGDRGGHVLGKAIARYARGPQPRGADRRRLSRGAGPGRTRPGRRGRLPHGQPPLHRRGRPVPPRVPRPARPGRGQRRGRHVGGAHGRGRPDGLDPPGRPASPRGRPGARRTARAGPAHGDAHRRQRRHGGGRRERAGRRRAAGRAAAGRQGLGHRRDRRRGSARPAWSATASTTRLPWPRRG